MQAMERKMTATVSFRAEGLPAAQSKHFGLRSLALGVRE